MSSAPLTGRDGRGEEVGREQEHRRAHVHVGLLDTLLHIHTGTPNLGRHMSLCVDRGSLETDTQADTRSEQPHLSSRYSQLEILFPT